MDDNFFACAKWEELLNRVLETGKRFQFRQGLDLRIMDQKKMQLLFQGKIDDSAIFAFDNIADKELIVRKLELLSEVIGYIKKKVKLYVLCGYDWQGKWQGEFWEKDIRDVFERVYILMKYGCIPYIMRYEKWMQAPEIYRGMYINLARWCNQPAQYGKKSLREFCKSQGEHSSSFRYLTTFEKIHPKFSKYLDMKFEEVSYGRVYPGGD